MFDRTLQDCFDYAANVPITFRQPGFVVGAPAFTVVDLAPVFVTAGAPIRSRIAGFEEGSKSNGVTSRPCLPFIAAHCFLDLLFRHRITRAKSYGYTEATILQFVLKNEPQTVVEGKSSDADVS